MYFESWEDAFTMAGHGVYVWSAYALTAAVLFMLIALPLLRARETRRAIQAELRRRRAAEQTPSASHLAESHPSEVDHASQA